MSWLWGPSTNPQYEELVEQACSPMKLQFPQDEDIALNLEITDMIRSKAVQPKPAMQALKKRVASKNGRVQQYALSLIDTCIKNGGDHFLAEIASKEFVDEMSATIRSPSTNPEVRIMATRLFQQWALAFQPKRELAFLVDVYNELKNSGVQFPPPPTGSSSALLETATAPAWVDSEFCMRCRSAFTFTNRKHHCRSCGLIFDQACSSKVMPLPKFGIKEPVRVCDGCWNKADKNKPTPAVPGRTPRTRQDFDADLQRAIELSLAQAQPGAAVPSEPPIAYGNGSVEDDDEQLRLAIEASLREMERARPSAPSEEPEYKPLPTFDLNPRETETILTFTNTIDQMAAYGERDLRRFPQVHMLAGQAHAVGGKLQRNSEEKTTKTQMLMEMQSKLNEAVTLYGHILDGQAAYSARKAQEAQAAAAYAQQQQAQWAQPQHYGAYQQPHANGYHVPQQYAPPHAYAHAQSPPPQSQPQPQHVQSPVPAPAQAAPGMYPSMPAMPAYGYQQPYAYQPQTQTQPWQAPAAAQPQAQPQPSAPHPSVSRQNSYASPQQPARQNSYAAPSEPQGHGFPAIPDPAIPSSPKAQASGPPPIDLASHPSMSPRSVSSHLPSQPLAATPSAPPSASPSAPSAPARSASFTSPTPASAPLASPPPVSTALPSAPAPSAPATAPASTYQSQQPQTASSPVSAPYAPNPWSNEYNQPQHHQPQQQQQQQQQQNQQQLPYTPSMFPSAPSGFAEPEPATPAPAREEALLIEL